MGPFEQFSVLRNVVRHDECQFLFDAVRELRYRADEAWYEHFTKVDPVRPLSQQEMWDLAIEEALLVIDSRMTWLREQ